MHNRCCGACSASYSGMLQGKSRTPVPAVAKVSGSDCFRYVPRSVCTMPAAASSLAVNAP